MPVKLSPIHKEALKKQKKEIPKRCSFCNKKTDVRGDGKGMWLCLPCARLQEKVWNSREIKIKPKPSPKK